MSSQPITVLPPRGMTLAVRYAAFATLATLINLAAQAVSLSLYTGPWHLAMAMMVGTLSGLVPKYLADKRWIFQDRTGGIDSHARKFTLYTSLSVATTLIFWATEGVFDRLGHGGRLMDGLGTVIGLAIGYWAKYHLDKRLTFA
jgi:putative flippase GtrA